LTEIDGVRSWLFRTVSTETLLDELETEGVAVRAATDPRALQRVIPLDAFSAEVRGAAMRALPAYLAFFCLENSVRELVADRMQEAYGVDWWEDHASGPIQNKVADRKEKEGRNRWHVRRGEHEIYYTDFGDLKSLIQNNWALFDELFPDQNWLLARFDELEASRNIIAHGNLLDERELARLQLYLHDWTRQVG
jgi:hypothetical protein